MKKDVWNITVLQENTYRVVFDRKVTKEEAMQLYDDQEHTEVLDWWEGDPLEIAEVY